MTMSIAPALTVEDLTIDIDGASVVDGVSFSVGAGEVIALVGESGCGKSLTALALLGLLPDAARIVRGRIMLDDVDLVPLPEREMRRVRGSRVSIIFQEATASLDPLTAVGSQIAEAYALHHRVSRSEARTKAKDMLVAVGIPDPDHRLGQYPFELSGGMCQRIMIAIALACRPALLIADEPTTGLDVTTQAVIMDLIGELAHESGMATIFITHDLALAAEYCDRIVVMHAGHIVEAAPGPELFAHPRHPYSAKLLAATPGETASLADMASIPGGLPDLRRVDLPACRYSDRCERRTDECVTKPLPRRVINERHLVACWHPL